MPTPTGIRLVKVKTKSTAYAGEYIKVTNLTSGGTIRKKIEGTTGEIIINPADEGQTAWAVGDTIQAEINGRLLGYASGTMAKSGVTLTMNDAADTSSPAIDL